jgi:hypothetical protein
MRFFSSNDLLRSQDPYRNRTSKDIGLKEGLMSQMCVLRWIMRAVRERLRQLGPGRIYLGSEIGNGITFVMGVLNDGGMAWE